MQTRDSQVKHTITRAYDIHAITQLTPKDVSSFVFLLSFDVKWGVCQSDQQGIINWNENDLHTPTTTIFLRPFSLLILACATSSSSRTSLITRPSLHKKESEVRIKPSAKGEHLNAAVQDSCMPVEQTLQIRREIDELQGGDINLTIIRKQEKVLPLLLTEGHSVV